MVLRKLADDAGRNLGEKVTEAVITVPAYFNDAQRTATKDAGRIAGLEVLRIINEPTAAALAYGLDKKEHETVLVFDLGGGTFDVSILDVGDGVVEVRATAGDTHLGGDDFDRRIVDHLADEFQKENGIDLRNDPQALQRLFEAAEKAKVELSSVTQTQVNLPFITADATGPEAPHDHAHALDVRAAHRRPASSGAWARCSRRWPTPRSSAERHRRGHPRRRLDPDPGRAEPGPPADRRQGPEHDASTPTRSWRVGAAIQAGVLKGEVKDVLLLDVTPLSLGVETLGGVMTKVIERNTTIPARRTEIFSTAEDNQPAVDVVVLQGERERAADNRVLGRFRLDRHPAGAAGRAADRGDLRHRRQRHPQRHRPGQGHRRGAADHDQRELQPGRSPRSSGWSPRPSATAPRTSSCAQEVDARNELDRWPTRSQRRLDELGDAVPAHERARAEMLIADARQAVKEQAPIDRVRSLTAELQQRAQRAAGQPAAPAAGSGTEDGRASPRTTDVIDAEFDRS